MTLIPCSECHRSVSDLAPTCPNCGTPIAGSTKRETAQPVLLAKEKKKTGCFTTGCAVLAGLFLILLVISLRLPSFNPPSVPQSSSEPQPATAPPPSPPPGSQWNYTHLADTMAKGQIHQAVVLSSNTVTFDFPYSGAQRATLILRTHPRYGKDVIFQIERGQILCPSYEGCSVLVRFGEGEAVSFRAAGPADSSTEAVFIHDYEGFIRRMLRASRVRIAANIYQEGSPTFEFDVAGFDQAKYRPPK